MEKKIEVSDNFVEIYKNFNVSSQSDKMDKLSKKELYLLLILCVDKHSDEDPVCINNYKNYSKELTLISSLQDGEEVNDDIIKQLCDETDDKTINVDILVDSSGNKLPDPMKKNEVRDAKIHNVLDNSK